MLEFSELSVEITMPLKHILKVGYRNKAPANSRSPFSYQKSESNPSNAFHVKYDLNTITKRILAKQPNKNLPNNQIVIKFFVIEDMEAWNPNLRSKRNKTVPVFPFYRPKAAWSRAYLSFSSSPVYLNTASLPWRWRPAA